MWMKEGEGREGRRGEEEDQIASLAQYNNCKSLGVHVHVEVWVGVVL